MLGLGFDESDVGALRLRSIVAPAACDVSVLRIHRHGRGLDGVQSYAYIPFAVPS